MTTQHEANALLFARDAMERLFALMRLPLLLLLFTPSLSWAHGMPLAQPQENRLDVALSFAPPHLNPLTQISSNIPTRRSRNQTGRCIGYP